MYRHTLRIMDDSSLSKVWLLVVCAVGLCLASTCALAAGDAGKGRSLYPVCTACHGAKGEGNAAMKAPKLAGQTGWYLKRQMELFQQGARGTAAGDMTGMQMAAMAKGPQLASDAALDDLVAYIGSFPETQQAPTIQGDAEAGATLYATCAACHGKRAEGNEAMAGPRLAGQSDWYLVAQLQKFRDGQRGYHNSDHGGRQMRAISDTVATEAAMHNVVAYINSLTD